MENQFWILSYGKIYLLLIMAVAIFLFFRLVGRYKPFIYNKKVLKTVSNYLPAAELFIWLLFSIWAIKYLWFDNRLFAIVLSIILTLLLLGFSWITVRDFLYGVVLRASGKLSKNEKISIGNYSGKVISIQSRHLIMETDKGETVFLPYHKVFDNVIVKSNPTEMVLSYTFSIPFAGRNSPEETIKILKRTIMTLPWSSLKKEPKIRIVKQNNNNEPELEITVYALSSGHFADIEQFVRKRYGGVN